MNFYMAPLEGITGYIYRNAYHKMFYPMDKYFTPFITATKNKKLKSKELRDIHPDNNQGLTIVPQIMANDAEDFLSLLKQMEQYGYQEVNLNLGCPSGTVVTKMRGAGFLGEKEKLRRFFDVIFQNTDTQISVKTRLGISSPDEFYDILEIYNEFPLKELIIHPRVLEDYYKNKPNLETFNYAINRSKHPVCYNGNLFTKKDYEEFVGANVDVTCVMFGRGILCNPGLPSEISDNTKITKEKLREFHDRIYDEYREILSGDHNVLFKMKELWNYMGVLFEEAHKERKKIQKSKKLLEYNAIIDYIFGTYQVKSISNSISI